MENFKQSTIEFGRKAKEQVCDKAVRAGNWAVRNKEMIVISAPILIAGIKSGQSLLVNKRLKDERKRIDNTYYDPSTGAHWELKRKLSNDERAELMARRRNGEFVEDILDDMRVLR